MRKNWRVLVPLSGSVLVVLILTAWLRPEPGPKYRGKTARQWVRQLAYSSYPAVTHEALKEIGPRHAVPVLAHELLGKPAVASKFYNKLFRKMPLAFQRELPQPMAIEEYRSLVFYALLRYERKDLKAAVPALIRAVQSPDSWARLSATVVLSNAGNEAVEALPVLWQHVRKHGAAASMVIDVAASMNAAAAIQKIDPHNVELASLLAEWLSEERTPSHVKVWAAKILGRMGSATQFAIPLLIEARDSQDEALSNEASDSLQFIQRDVAAQSPAPSVER